MQFVTEADYDAVRALIDSKLTETDLSGATIAQPPFHPAAEAWVMSRYPSAGSATGDDAAKLKRAVMYYLAALLIPTVARLISVSITANDVSYTRQAIDIQKRIKELRALAEAEIEALESASASSPSRPTMFSAGKKGRRSS